MTGEATPLKILVADDDPSLRLALCMVLEQRGHLPIPAADTAAAREAIGTHRPDVALVDAGMPRNGVAFWEELQHDGSVPGGALLLTGDVYALGALARHPRVLGKPFDYGRLVERLQRMAAGMEEDPARAGEAAPS